MDWKLLFVICWSIFFAKVMVWGSEYSFHYRIKYGKEYSDWYHNRQTFKEYLDNKEKVKSTF